MKKVRFGVIGVGGMGQGHCNSLKKVEEAQLAAVCDIDPPTAEKVGQTHQVPHFTDYRQLLRAGLCDAVIVATPHPARPAIAIAAMKAGLHLISEKPLAERVSAADRMIRTARAAGVAFGVMFQRRTEPVYVKAIEIVKSGALGKIYRTAMISPEYRSQAYYNSAGWRANWVGEGGGVMMNQAPHIFDLFILLGGMPAEVFGRTETRLHSIEVEDLAEALLRYPDGGTGYFYCSTNEPGPGQMIEIFGDKGKLSVRDGQLRWVRYEPAVSEFTRGSTVMWSAPKAIEQPVEVPVAEAGHAVITRNFARHILHGEPLISPGAEGIRSLELANAVWLSAELGKPVKLPISRRAYDALLARKRRASRGATQVGAVRRETDPRHKT
jgi:predicted dehydrogenase